ncbi:CPCC family cysteine-rich protein [Sphingobacterium sp. LRF_L2]|uniref:CPCC family cysteine-rich protein n=1 Tax=Sphingobacterium sp. LRF_L2 TaxID=3369421 RepID=UPI003F617BD7
MKNQESYIDNLKERRDFFHNNFELKIGLQRADVNSTEVLKNSCPVCGYFTLDERNSFEICAICFWEDDGADDFEVNEESGPNHMTLKEGRIIFQEAKRKLFTKNIESNILIDTLKIKFMNLDNLIKQNNLEESEIIKLHNEIINLLKKNKVYGLEKLFDK